MNQIDAISAFLKKNSPKDLAALFSDGMEVQVNAAPDGGERVTGTFNGHSWQGWSADGGKTVWKHLRIPYSAWDNPSYDDKRMSWSLEEHCDGIGLTGWNWKEQTSRFVVFDFDSVANHKPKDQGGAGLSDSELDSIVAALSQVPWVTIRTSKSGKGRHIYVQIAKSPEVANHGEHAAVARSILCLLSAASGCDLRGPVDCFGVVAWIWHRDAKEGGFKVLKQGMPLAEVPKDWKSHIDVVTRRKARVATPAQVGAQDDVDALLRQTRRVPLDDQHKKLTGWFAIQDGAKCLWSWSSDLWMLTCHTYDLARAHKELGLPGVFRTSSTGKDLPDQNCFAFPLPGGSWEIRRHGKGIAEDASWYKDATGWTRCEFGVPATIETATRMHGGNIDLKNVCHFGTLKAALAAMREIEIDIAEKGLDAFLGRKAEIHQSKSKLAVRFKREGDETVSGEWVNKNGRYWESYYEKAPEKKPPIETPDEMVRAVVTGGSDGGYYVWARDRWIYHTASNVVRILSAHGIPPADAQVAMGAACLNYWDIVNEPFADEYPGDRRWNKNGAQLAYVPKEGPHPTWDKILAHLGRGLDDAVLNSEWCKEAKIMTGHEYLLAWTCSLFQRPTIHLPYLFFHSRAQVSGKSTLHEALSLMFRDLKGYTDGKRAIEDKNGYNGELSGAILCFIEEIDLRKNKAAYTRMKEWINGKTISIRALYENSRDEQNTTHWIQCANSTNYCPIESGDMRIVMIQVPELREPEKRETMFDKLREEAPAFLWTCLHNELPPSGIRMGIEPVNTSTKQDQMDANKSRLEWFVDEMTVPAAGMAIKWSEFYERFRGAVEVSQQPFWSQRRVKQEMPGDFPRGKYGKAGDIYVGNIRWKDTPEDKGQALLVRDLNGDRLVRRGG